jgi:hypothetical protein
MNNTKHPETFAIVLTEDTQEGEFHAVIYGTWDKAIAAVEKDIKALHKLEPELPAPSIVFTNSRLATAEIGCTRYEIYVAPIL